MTSRTIVRPKVNEPVVVRLDTANGVEKTGQYGTDYFYACNQGAVSLYLKPEAHAALQALQPQAGDEVRILGVKRGKDIAWSITFVSDAQELPAASNGAAGPRVTYASGVKFPPRVFAQPESAPSVPQPARRPAPVTPTASVPEPHQPGSHLAQCLCRAIDAAIEASEYARTKNFSVTFLGSDIRALANCLLIGDERRSA